MTRITIKRFLWDKFNIEHIRKHGVSQAEVEEVSENFATHKRGKKGRYLVIGRSGKRILSVIVNNNGSGAYYPVTARDSNKKERGLLYEKEKRQV
jgi:uncharacterized protein